MKTYYINQKNKKYLKIFNIRIYSFLTLLIYILIFPFSLLYKNNSLKKLDQKKYNRFYSPKYIANKVSAQILQNIYISKSISDYNKSNYIFVLQPTLLYSNPQTAMDKKLKNSMKKYKNIDLLTTFKEYYSLIKKNLINKKKLNKNNFLDTSQIFEKSKKQFFIDGVHLGNIGQLELSKIIGKKIIEIEKRRKK